MTTTKKATTERERTSRVDPKELLPELPPIEESGPGEKYWIGALPELPMNSVDIGQVSFPVTTEIVKLDERTGGTVRIPGMGVIRPLRKETIDLIIARLPRLIVRWRTTAREPLNTIPGDKYNDEEEAQTLPSRQGFIISIPTAEDKAKQIAAQRYRPYIREDGDTPLANYVYMLKQNHRDEEYPDPVSVTGIPL